MKHQRLSYNKIRKATQKEKQEAIRIHDEYRRLGIKVNTFSQDIRYTKDEIDAMRFIVDNKPLPADLEKRLLEKKEEETNNVSHTIEVSDEEIEDFLK